MTAGERAAPDRPVLVYDGRCRFCVAQARRLERWVGGRVRIESFRDPGVLAKYPALTEERCEAALQLVFPDGRVAGGAEAVSRTLRLSPLLAPAGWLYEVPPLRRALDAAYAFVARNRFRLQGEVCEDAECRLHPHARADTGGAPRARIRDLFLRLLGLMFLVAFLSLLSQVTLLFGRRGLLPAREYLDALRGAGAGLLGAPTLFWSDASDGALVGAAAAGALASVLLLLGIAPRLVLVALWALYLSLATIGQDFLSFQWDNLLLESAFFSFFIAPAGWRPRRAPPPGGVGVFLMLWLVFRLHVESGAAKLLTGDPTWRDLSAMATYYETAPLPTWVGWHVHQMPLWAHKACSLFTFVVEIGLPLAIWGPRRLRGAVFVVMLAMQASIVLTGNYGFFNYLSAALCLFVLDDGHLAWALRWLRRGKEIGASRTTIGGPGAAGGEGGMDSQARAESPRRSLALLLLAVVLVPLSVVPFLRFIRPLDGLERDLAPVRRALYAFRSINAYHLFATMTIERREVVIEGSGDGETWRPYEFRHKPGDPTRAPGFVAPHQPRVDFQLWFLTLRGGRVAPYFDRLLERLFTEPRVVASLFARDPFPDAPPTSLRVALYRYRFTDAAARRESGAWWRRDLEGYSRVFTPESVRQR